MMSTATIASKPAAMRDLMADLNVAGCAREAPAKNYIGMFIAPGRLRIIRMQSSLRFISSCDIPIHECMATMSASDIFIRFIIVMQPEFFILSDADMDMHECITCRSAEDIALWRALMSAEVDIQPLTLKTAMAAPIAARLNSFIGLVLILSPPI